MEGQISNIKELLESLKSNHASLVNTPHDSPLSVEDRMKIVIMKNVLNYKMKLTPSNDNLYNNLYFQLFFKP